MESPICIPKIPNNVIKDLDELIYKLKLEVLHQISIKTGKDFDQLKEKYLKIHNKIN